MKIHSAVSAKNSDIYRLLKIIFNNYILSNCFGYITMLTEIEIYEIKKLISIYQAFEMYFRISMVSVTVSSLLSKISNYSKKLGAGLVPISCPYQKILSVKF